VKKLCYDDEIRLTGLNTAHFIKKEYIVNVIYSYYLISH
jgi:hypothetical protein